MRLHSAIIIVTAMICLHEVSYPESKSKTRNFGAIVELVIEQIVLNFNLYICIDVLKHFGKPAGSKIDYNCAHKQSSKSPYICFEF